MQVNAKAGGVASGAALLRMARVSSRRQAASIEAIIVAVSLVLPFLLLSPFFESPLMNDEGIFAVVAREILRGGLPYRDLFDIAPPMVYLWYAAAFVTLGDSIRTIHLLVPVAYALVVVLIHLQGALTLPRRSRCVATMLFAMTSGMVQLGMWAEKEYLALPPLATALVAFTLARRSGGVFRFAVVGFFSAIAVLTSHVLILPFLVFLVLGVRSSRQWGHGQGLKAAVAMIAGAAIVGAGVVAPFIARGAMSDLIYGLVRFPVLYADSVPVSMRALFFVVRSCWFLWVAGPLLVLAGAGIWWTRRQPTADRRLLLLWVGSLVLAVAIPGRFHWYYFVYLLPGLALLAGHADARLAADSVPSGRKVLVGAILLLATLASASLNASVYRMDTSEARFIAKVDTPHRIRDAQSVSVAANLKDRTDADDFIYNLGHQAELYYYSERDPASRIFHEFPMRSDASARTAALEDIKRNRPVYVIDTLWPKYVQGIAPKYPWEFADYLQEHYVLERRVDFDPGLRAIHDQVSEDRYRKRSLTYYGDIWRLKD